MTAKIEAAILALDGHKNWGEVEDAREKLVPLGRKIFPFALSAYPTLRSYMARTSLVYTAMKFALVEDDAVTLALMALEDRSARVIYYACMLLAVAGRHETIVALKALENHKNPDVRSDASAAVMAILEDNRDLFLDRNRTGLVRIKIGGLIDPIV